MSGAISAVSVAGATAAAAGASTAGIAAAALSANAGLIGLIGSGVAAVSSIQSGNQGAASARYNAQVAANNAETAKQNANFAGQEGDANAGIEQIKTRANVGSIKASQAANGIDVNTGSAVDVRSSAAEIGELNALNIRSNAARQAYGYQTQANSDVAQSQLDRQEAKYDAKAGYVKAGATLLGGAAKSVTSGMWDNYLNGSSLNGGSVTTGSQAASTGLGGEY